MSNCCFSNIEVKASSVQAAALLYEEFGKAMDKPTDIKTGDYFKDHWLGKLLNHIGIPYNEVVHGKIRCRGTLDSYSLDGDTIVLQTDTANSPMFRCIRKFVETVDKNAKIFFLTDLPDDGVFYTNMPEHVGDLYIDAEIDNPDAIPEYLRNIQDSTDTKDTEFLAWGREYFNMPDADFEELCEIIWDVYENSGCYYSIHVYELAELDDFD